MKPTEVMFNCQAYLVTLQADKTYRVASLIERKGCANVVERTIKPGSQNWKRAVRLATTIDPSAGTV